MANKLSQMAIALEKNNNYDFSVVMKEIANLGSSATTPAGWVAIDVTTNKQGEFEAIGEWAVIEHNEQTRDNLKFQKVMKGWMKGNVGCTFYILILKAKDGHDCNNEYATIVEDIIINKKLVYFTKVSTTNI